MIDMVDPRYLGFRRRQSQWSAVMNAARDLRENTTYEELIQQFPNGHIGNGWIATRERFAAMCRYYLRGETIWQE